MATMEKNDMPRTRRSFPDEFKTDAVAMVLDDGREIVDVTEAIGVGEGEGDPATGSGWRRSSAANALV
jgi:transposase-like protein